RIRERHADDKMKQQQELMALYKKHKINPAAGCLPIIPQMFIFFALYKVLFTTIEIRHEGFLWIRDLSEQDPTTIFNLFGLLPFDPTTAPVIGAFLGVGILPLLMGAAMWVQTKLNPPPADPMQAQIFGLLPLIFIFIFAPFAAGLVLYWFWNTFLGVVQQYFIMKRNGAEVDLLDNIKSTFGKKTDPKEKPAE
ncbi:MAG: membrane protein insertase YidC, partial [Planctomycetota bacterium]